MSGVVEGLRLLRSPAKPEPPSLFPSPPPSAPPTLDSPQHHLDKAQLLVAKLDSRNTPPSEAMAALRTAFEWLCSTAEAAKQVLEKVPVASDYTPIVSAVLFVATLWGVSESFMRRTCFAAGADSSLDVVLQKGQEVEENCRAFAFRLCEVYERSTMLRAQKEDFLDAGYDK
jgi:hypothetical protein